MAWPTSKYAGSMSPSSSALSSASRCRKSGTDPRSGARPGVPRIPTPSLHGPVCDEPVAEGLDVGLPPPLELPYGLDDLLVQPREPLSEGAGYPVRELEGRRAALRDHPSEGLARYLDARHPARRLHGRRGPALPEQAPLPRHGRLARRLYLREQPIPAPGETLPDLDPPRGEHVQAPRLRPLLDDGLPLPEGDRPGCLGELLPLLFRQELEEPDPLQPVFHPLLTLSAPQPLTPDYMPAPSPTKRAEKGGATGRRGRGPRSGRSGPARTRKVPNIKGRTRHPRRALPKPRTFRGVTR